MKTINKQVFRSIVDELPDWFVLFVIVRISSAMMAAFLLFLTFSLVYDGESMVKDIQDSVRRYFGDVGE